MPSTPESARRQSNVPPTRAADRATGHTHHAIDAGTEHDRRATQRRGSVRWRALEQPDVQRHQTGFANPVMPSERGVGNSSPDPLNPGQSAKDPVGWARSEKNPIRQSEPRCVATR